MWQVAPIAILLVVQIWRQIQSGLIGRMWFMDIALLAGWVLGWLLVEAEGLFYVYVTNPHELNSQRVQAEIAKKNWRGAWDLLESTKHEHKKLPIRNILTVFVITGLGIWVVTSSGSFLASGLVLGFLVRLLSEILTDSDYKSWYWIFARDFSKTEHQGLLAAWIIGLIWIWFTLLRG